MSSSNTAPDESTHQKTELDLEAQPNTSPAHDMADKEEHPNAGSDNEEGYQSEKSLDWTSKDDPENPMNWPKGKKIFHTMLPALFGFVM